MTINLANYSNQELWNKYQVCYNTLVWRLTLTRTQSYIVGIGVAFVIIPTVLINGILLLALIRTKQQRLSCFIYIKFLAGTGCLSGLIGTPIWALIFTVYFDSRCCALEVAAVFIMQYQSHLLVYTTLMLAVDRYFSTHPKINPRSGVAKKVLSFKCSYICICFINVLSLIHGVVSTNFFTTMSINMAKQALIALNFGVAIGVYSAYLKLYCALHRHEKSLRSLRLAQDDSKKVKKGPKYIREFTKTIAVILVAGIVCYLPFNVMDVWTGLYTYAKMPSPRQVRFAYYLSVIPALMNSMINGLLFLYRNENARNHVNHKMFAFKVFTSSNNVESTSLQLHSFVNQSLDSLRPIRDNDNVENDLCDTTLSSVD